MSEAPAETLRRAVKLMRKAAASSGTQTHTTVSQKIVYTTIAVADLLDERARYYDDLARTPYGPAGAAFIAGDFGGDADLALRVARIYLGEEVPG